MRQRFAKWMMGRNGMDALNRLLSVLTRLRVPRGKGKINIVCRKCGTSFQRKT